MGCWDVVCSLCALPLNSCSEERKKWMSKCSLLLNNNKVVHDTQEIACNTNFYDKKKKPNFPFIKLSFFMFYGPHYLSECSSRKKI